MRARVTVGWAEEGRGRQVDVGDLNRFVLFATATLCREAFEVI